MAKRPIEFRAWDTVGQKMWSVTSIEFSNSPGFIEKYGLGVDFVFSAIDKDGNIFTGSSVDCVLMQFTGQYDRKGTQIFEDDILSDGTPDTAMNVVEYDNGCFNPFDTFRSDVYENIGNIFENPDGSKK